MDYYNMVDMIRLVELEEKLNREKYMTKKILRILV
jgi:hypothetical protein